MQFLIKQREKLGGSLAVAKFVICRTEYIQYFRSLNPIEYEVNEAKMS